MPDPGGRREELLAAAATGALEPGEHAELDALLARDATAAPELAALRATLAALPPSGSGWRDEALPPDLRQRVLAATTASPAPDPWSARTRPRLLAAAAALVVLGAAGGAGATALAGRAGPSASSEPAPGAPGALGAREAIDLSGAPAGVVVDAALVAHTWGTETVLDVDGLPAGVRYSVVLVGTDGTEEPSGTFLGSEVAVECRLNAAVLRPEVARVEVRSDDGSLVMASDLPPVTA